MAAWGRRAVVDVVSREPEAEAAIRLVLAKYCQLCDDGDFESWAECFTRDATYTVMGQTHEGRDAVKAFIEAAQPPERRGKHFLGQSVIEIDGAAASGVTDYVFVARSAAGSYAITSAGRYHDTFAAADDGTWRIRTREVSFL
jgi:uncharacterized protein (TIGR02246 family)